MVALFCAQMETPTKRLISAVCVIAVGTAIASYGEVHLSTLGVIFMFSSEMFEAIRLVMTQMLLVGLKLHPSEYRDPLRLFWGLDTAPLHNKLPAETRILVIQPKRASSA